MMKNAWIPLGVILAAMGLSKNSSAQEGTCSAYGNISGYGVNIPEGARVDVYSDNNTPETSDDFFVGRGSTLYYEGDTMYAVNHIQRDLAGTSQREGFGDDDMLYFIFGIDNDTTSYEASPDKDFVNNKIAAPAPTDDLNIDLYVKRKHPTGIDDVHDAFYSGGLKAYPNPTKGPLTVDVADDDAIKEVRIFDTSGKLVRYDMTGMERSDIYRLDISDFPSGCYFITVETVNGHTSTQKQIKR